MTTAVHGECDPHFRSVREEFEANLRDRGEVGASVCVTLEGRTVVDLWGGVADRRTGRGWDRDTVVVVWSCTKGAIAVCAHVLRSRGLLDLDAPVARYWPEFASEGKDAIPVRWLLNHQAGLPAFRRPLPPGALYNWDHVIETLAAEAPFWEPGTRQGYHASTFGHLVGEVVRRVSGRDPGTFFRDEIAGPLKLDFNIGLPERDEGRVARIVRADSPPPEEAPRRFMEDTARIPDSPAALTVNNTGRRPGDHDSREAHAAVLPSQGGIANARGLAGLYGPMALGGAADGVILLDSDTLAEAGAVSSATAADATLRIGLRFGLGFMKSSDNRRSAPGTTDSIIMSEPAFGHAGMGGSLGFADPAARLSFGYAMNKQGRGVMLNERGQSLVDAVYRSLGCRSDRSGRWR
jgi:CubicO group peptidase (beta-lactamase class C family)